MGLNRAGSPIVWAAALTALLLVTNLALLRFDRRLGTAACFPLAALATIANAVAWTLTVARGLIGGGC
jgi:hypothetical protein